MKIRVVGLSVLGASALVAGGLALFAFDFPRLSSNEMAPGLRTRDLLLACRVCGNPKRGDVVFFMPPDAPGTLSARRVAALPGDTVAVKKGVILVNDRPLFDEKAGTVTLEGIDAVDEVGRPFDQVNETLGTHRFVVIRDARTPVTGDRAPETLKDEYFVLADRRTFARDSRDYGAVPRTSIRSIVKRVITAGNKDADRQTWLP
jgi:signal peptidase I